MGVNVIIDGHICDIHDPIHTVGDMQNNGVVFVHILATFVEQGVAVIANL